MKKFLKWTGIVLLSLVLLIACSAWFLSSNFNNKFEKVYNLTPASVAIPTDSASIARGALSEVEIERVYNYIQSLPAAASNTATASK